MNNDDLKEEIKNRIKLSEIISKKVILKRKSENSFIGLCPFHSEKTPSFHVHDEKQFYHCFGCEKHGDIFSFTMETENLDFYRSLKYLASLTGLTVSNKSYQNISFQNKYKTLELSSNFFIENLVKEAIELNAAKSIRDMGKVMSYLKEKYSTNMDFSKASKFLKETLI